MCFSSLDLQVYMSSRFANPLWVKWLTRAEKVNKFTGLKFTLLKFPWLSFPNAHLYSEAELQEGRERHFPNYVLWELSKKPA